MIPPLTSRRPSVLLVAFLLLGSFTACGGGGGEEIELVPIAAIDPCELLTEDEASRLAGAEVERDEAAVGSALAGAIGCGYRFTDDADEESAGRALAASLVIEPAEAAAPDVISARTEAASDDLDGAQVGGAALGDGGLVASTEQAVRVVYVVRTVVVTVEVGVADDAVGGEKVAEVSDFALDTVEPVKLAVDKTFDGADRVTVPATANVYLAGQDEAPDDGQGATLPPAIDLDALGDPDELTFAVTGFADHVGPPPRQGGDGKGGGTDTVAGNGIAGLQADSFFFLVGVFVGDEAPDHDDGDPAGEPVTVDDPDPRPELGVPFPVGDGRDADGTTVTFPVPEGATHLHLGFVDGGGSTPSGYYDNSGALYVAVDSP